MSPKQHPPTPAKGSTGGNATTAAAVPAPAKTRVMADSGKHPATLKKSSDPIVDNWSWNWPGQELGYKGTASLTVNPDGSWDFSGQAPQQFYTTVFNAGASHTPGSGDTHFYRWDIVFGIKSSQGSAILFTHSTELRGDKPQNASFNKQGNNKTIKENFASFAKKHEWHAHSYVTPVMPEGSSGGGGSSVGQDIISGLESALGVVGPLLALL